MKTFIYVTQDSPKRGYNRRIRVYRVTRNLPVYLGCQDVHTASYKGDKATACEVIAEAGEGKLDLSGYRLANTNDRVIEV